MKKADKKLDKQIVKALTTACETVKCEVDGFQWLTHFVNHNDFPDSLKVVCVFSTISELATAKQKLSDTYISNMIVSELETNGIRMKNKKDRISFDSEEACLRDHNGNWGQRYK